MSPLMIPITHPGFYWGLAFVASVYYGTRGVLIQRHQATNENIRLENREPEEKPWTSFEITWVHCIQDFIYNATCSLAGFAALYVECKVFESIRTTGTLSNIPGGTVVLIGFLSLIAILGISGQLPFILYHGKIFTSEA